MGVPHPFDVFLEEGFDIAGGIFCTGGAEEVCRIQLETDVGIDAFRPQEIGDAECVDPIALQSFEGVFDEESVAEHCGCVARLIEILDELRKLCLSPVLLLWIDSKFFPKGRRPGESGPSKSIVLARPLENSSK